MRALVTGAAGYLGSSLAHYLHAHGSDVVAVDTFGDAASRARVEAALAGRGNRIRLQLVEGRLQDQQLTALLEGRTHVFHLAATSGSGGSLGRELALALQEHVVATQLLLDACVGRPLTRVIYGSSFEVYGNAAVPTGEGVALQPVSAYGVSKLAGEHLCRLYHAQHGVPVVSLRYFSVFGPHQPSTMAVETFLRSVHAGEPAPIYGDGEQTRDFIYVDDAVRATVLAAQFGVPGRAYNVGSGVAVSINELLGVVARVTGRRPLVAQYPPKAMEIGHARADTALALRELEFGVKVEVEEGIGLQYQALIHGLQRSGT
jgi:UDP-glucuronate 4-epimerase